MKKCFRCKKKYDPATQRDGEHIIPSFLQGQLKSKNIYCEPCNNTLGSNEDARFKDSMGAFLSKVFDIKDKKLIGKDLYTGVIASPLDLWTLNGERVMAGDAVLVNIKDGKVTPSEPLVFIGKGKVFFFANKTRFNQQKVLLNELLDKIDLDANVNDAECVDNIYGEFVIEINLDNEAVLSGVMKIAVGYAIYCGVSHNELEHLMYPDYTFRSDLGVYPYYPVSRLERLYETIKDKVELGYPNHKLKLFDHELDGGNRALICYVELFGVFQFYVQLSNAYSGDEILKVYSQTTIPPDLPVVSIREPKDCLLYEHYPEAKESFQKALANGTAKHGEAQDFIERYITNCIAKNKYQTPFSPNLEKFFVIFQQLNLVHLPKSNEKVLSQIKESLSEEDLALACIELKNAYAAYGTGREDQFFRSYYSRNDNLGKISWQEIHTTVTREEIRSYTALKFDQFHTFQQQRQLRLLVEQMDPN